MAIHISRPQRVRLVHAYTGGDLGLVLYCAGASFFLVLRLGFTAFCGVFIFRWFLVVLQFWPFFLVFLFPFLFVVILNICKFEQFQII
jgi:hypothetical protein